MLISHPPHVSCLLSQFNFIRNRLRFTTNVDYRDGEVMLSDDTGYDGTLLPSKNQRNRELKIISINKQINPTIGYY